MIEMLLNGMEISLALLLGWIFWSLFKESQDGESIGKIVLYNQDNRQAIEWLPNMKAGKGKETEDGVERKNINYYIKLDPIRTNKMRSIGKNLIKKLDYYYESY
jgi:hypothetical protein